MVSWLPEFEMPGRLWSLLALPVLIVLYIVFLKLKGRNSIRYTNTGVLGAVMGGQRRWTRHAAVAMALCSLVALSLAWARPLGVEKVPRERATVVMVVDNSLSMQAKDVEPDRLTAAKNAAQSFIDGLPKDYNVALVSLSGKPSVRMPPSTDRGALSRALGALELEEGTAIGDAITQSMNAISQAPKDDAGEQAPAMIVMLSDGTNTDGPDPQSTVSQAVQAQVPIFTIAFGTENGYVDIDGKRERVAPDKEALKSLAAATKGTSVDANSIASLSEAYKQIGTSVGYEDVNKPITGKYAFWALGFAIVAALGAIMMAARWPR